MTSDDIPIRDPDENGHVCARKLRAVQVSTHFQAILASPDGTADGEWRP